MGDDPNQKRVVWILGAGFSRSLGAPLLADLFSEESGRKASIQYGNLVDDYKSVVKMCQGGTYGLPHAKPLERQWQHAEQFLERIDLAIHEIKRKNLIEGANLHAFAVQRLKMFKNPAHAYEDWLPPFQLRALRLLAAEVCGFLEKANLDLEQWSPYRRWMKQLKPTDTVINFNYDRTVDLLAEKERLNTWIPDPQQLVDIEQGHNDRGQSVLRAPGVGATVLKLHGSVDWTRDGNRIVRVLPTELPESHPGCAALYFDEVEKFGIATPGPTKRSMVDAGGPLSALWDTALRMIGCADAIVFVGYRFPPTDAMSREKLLLRIGENGSSKTRTTMLNVHTVLGDDVNSTDSRRLKGMLEAVCLAQFTRITQWPMFAEDFLGLVSREQLV